MEVNIKERKIKTMSQMVGEFIGMQMENDMKGNFKMENIMVKVFALILSYILILIFNF